MKRLENPQTRPLLLEQIRDVLKNRQNVKVNGHSKDIRSLLNDLIQFDRGKAIIPPKHEEDYTIQILQNISFPSSDKIVPEGAYKQLLQEFGWPSMRDLSQVTFYFTKLLKELHHDRILPVILIENPDILRQKAYRILQVLSEFTIDRKPVGVPTILCASEHSGLYSNPFGGGCFSLDLNELLTTEEITSLIEEVCPGQSSIYTEEVIHSLSCFPSEAEIKARAKELMTYARKLGLSQIDNILQEQWLFERNRKRMKHAETVN